MHSGAKKRIWTLKPHLQTHEFHDHKKSTCQNIATDWEEFTIQVAIMAKVKALSNVLEDNVIKQHLNGKSYSCNIEQGP